MEPIFTFTGEYRFLSNFFPATFVWEDILWPNSEAAYQAAKSLDHNVRLQFAAMTNPATAKKQGRMIDCRSDWEEIKYDLMYEIVYAKFKQNSDLKTALLKTGSVRLEEGNTWNDKTWGVCPPGPLGKGKNWLGLILMDIRQQFHVENSFNYE